MIISDPASEVVDMVNLIQKAAPFILTPRVHAGIAASCVLVGMTVHGSSGWNYVLFAILAALSVTWIRWPDRKIMILIGSFAVSILAMPIYASLWGDQRSGVNFVFILAALPGLMLILIPGKVAKRAVELCLTWGALVFAISLLIDGLVGDKTLLRFSGISHTTNNVSGLLLLATGYACWKTNKYTFAFLALLLLGQLLTGSRMGIGLSALIIFVAVLHSPNRAQIFAAMLLSIIVYVALFPDPADSLITRSRVGFAMEQALDRSSYVSSRDLDWYLPSGALSRSANDTHMTFIRIMQEAGMIASIAFVALLAIAWRRGSDPARAGLLLMIATMTMDLYFWIPPNAVGFLWLFLAMTLKGDSYESTDNTLERIAGDRASARNAVAIGIRSDGSSGWAVRAQQ